MISSKCQDCKLRGLQFHFIKQLKNGHPKFKAFYNQNFFSFFTGMSIAGLTADAKSVSRWMRTECLQSRFYDNSALRVETLMCDLGNKMQNCIQLYNRRPYGVGLIVAGCDDLGPHIYQVHF